MQQLIQKRALRKALETDISAERAKFEETIALKKAQLNDIKDEEDKLQQEVILEMEKYGKDIIEKDGHQIIYQIRETKQIEDPKGLLDDIIKNSDKLEELGIGMSDIESEFYSDIQVNNKKLILDIVDKFEKVEGTLLNGINIKQTKFLTIKDI